MTEPTIVCALDPSLRKTGWVVLELRPTQVKVIGYGVFDAKSDKDGIDKRIAEQFIYTDWLIGLLNSYNVTTVCSEFPHGSKSNTAAVTLSMVTSVITAVCRAKNVTIEYESQFASKKHFIGSHIDIKDMIIITALKKYQKFGYIKPSLKPDAEATSDALAVFDLWISKRIPDLYKSVICC